MKPRSKVRSAVVSGQFYSDMPKVLRGDIEAFLDRAVSAPDPSVRGIIVPHAGYMYSGPVAAEAYRAIRGASVDTVVIVSFLHRVFIQGILVDDADFYETPLGRIPVERELCAAIRAEAPCFAEAVEGDLNEHSLEVQLPFLQFAIGDFSVVPVYMGEQSVANARALSDALAKHLTGRRALVVFSTDLSHFHPYHEAVRMDQKFIRMTGDRDFMKLCRSSDSGEIEACGLGPVITSLMLAETLGWDGPRLLKYANSGDVTGDKSSVVGYAAMVYKTGGKR
jgi:hypothetical protein